YVRIKTLEIDGHSKFKVSIQFNRTVHSLYADPGHVCSNQLANRLFERLYWALRALQFKIFYRNEELDVDDYSDRWEVGVQPPSLDELARKTHFNRRWIKYMYAKFKNECPSGRMKEPEFRQVLASIIAPERATDQYISRLFLAFSTDDKKTITFQNLIECLSLIQLQTAEANALWTIRIIAGYEAERFEFLSFTQSVFSLNEGKDQEESNKETVQQRANTIFNDGLYIHIDMIHSHRCTMHKPPKIGTWGTNRPRFESCQSPPNYELRLLDNISGACDL
ncbi:unnamed protein product, partial [Heligmosomoides polygyrus]|uniref:EF-hand domain-containing protein n=1 Tax=Heligmosomoides polygyrus TaxID=6339 RepID=A0A183FP15_HELPZ